MKDNDSAVNKSYRVIKVGDYYFIPVDPELAINAANEVFTEEVTTEGILLRKQRKDNQQ